VSDHTELEYKFRADVVGVQDFLDQMVHFRPESYESHSFNDVYYRRGDTVIRHRLLGNGELTVKKRKRDDSIVDRTEVNLVMTKDTTVVDVEAFMRETGFRREFVLWKKFAHVFHYDRVNFRGCRYKAEVALYAVARLEDEGPFGEHQFIEVEIKPYPNMPPEDALGELEEWKFQLQRSFPIGFYLDKSLYEMYSDFASINDM